MDLPMNSMECTSYNCMQALTAALGNRPVIDLCILIYELYDPVALGNFGTNYRYQLCKYGAISASLVMCYVLFPSCQMWHLFNSIGFHVFVTPVTYIEQSLSSAFFYFLQVNLKSMFLVNSAIHSPKTILKREISTIKQALSVRHRVPAEPKQFLIVVDDDRLTEGI